MITFGIDTHKGTLAASAVDDTGREVATRTFGEHRPGPPRARDLGQGDGSGATPRHRTLTDRTARLSPGSSWVPARASSRAQRPHRPRTPLAAARRQERCR
jgi:hypothetical protein